MDPEFFSRSTPRTPHTAKYAALLRRLELSCLMCGAADSAAVASPVHAAVSHAVGPSPKSAPPTHSHNGDRRRLTRQQALLSTPSSRGLSSVLSDTTDSSCDASSYFSGSFASYAPRWCGKETAQRCGPPRTANAKSSVAGASTSVSLSPPPPPLFEVRVRKHTRRHGKEEVAQQRLLFVQEFCGSTTPTPAKVHDAVAAQGRLSAHQTPCSPCGAAYRVAHVSKAVTPTTDDYFSHYLAHYRSQQSVSAPPTQRQTAANGDTSTEREVSCATAAETHEPPPCLSTPGCSPILVARDVDLMGREKDVCDSPDIVCRLFTSAASEDEEAF
ncbi:hypothetical protein ABB37_00220 [Leptomonas pyrrhocoris]|uniref:Uncharacterized protein n=1 Tax=Leptomonas pyrrhocoris TaxID=157538 RepID=A0A0N0E012_LEPPY|nr:hypothetical protein ABB37_00220 [Leptomonas pyrrhocoris]KPA85908.1 hypothetical protein ABB37_00220 [Leptomonas pyrrhocoris]|eukprot:XP_015664347.1 hypothetical protein ABB37_00220 [Leptomonas pyrrhocoris]